MYCIEESICDIVGTFRRPLQSFDAPIMIRRPGVAPSCPLVTPLGGESMAEPRVNVFPDTPKAPFFKFSVSPARSRTQSTAALVARTQPTVPLRRF